MTFTSVQFLIFILIVFPLYLVLPFRWQNRMLLVASYIFYGVWDWRFLLLLGFSTCFDFCVGLLLDKLTTPHARKICILSSVAANLTILGFFKYFNFFAGSFAILFNHMGIHLSWTTLNIVLPVGVSFYTFQSLAYTIDVYRGKFPATHVLEDFALFVAFFPQLVAGPISRPGDLLPFVQHPRTITTDGFTRGMFLILFGLFKKVAISDGLAPSVDAIYNATSAVSQADVALASYCFALQIYCDFSGYSDIARGLAKIMGFDLVTNFRVPYASTNPSEFWRRWHISLSTWLRDYLYITLGGNRQGEAKTYRNLMATMALGGLWHGAAWNYVLWGVYQGGILGIHRFISNRWQPRQRHPMLAAGVHALKLILFFQVVCYGWLLFRAHSFEQIVFFTSSLFHHGTGHGLSLPRPPLSVLVGLLLLAVFDGLQTKSESPTFYRGWPAPVRGAFYAATIFTLLMGLSNAPAQFIYFQF